MSHDNLNDRFLAKNAQSRMNEKDTFNILSSGYPVAVYYTNDSTIRFSSDGKTTYIPSKDNRTGKVLPNGDYEFQPNSVDAAFPVTINDPLRRDIRNDTSKVIISHPNDSQYVVLAKDANKIILRTAGGRLNDSTTANPADTNTSYTYNMNWLGTNKIDADIVVSNKLFADTIPATFTRGIDKPVSLTHGKEYKPADSANAATVVVPNDSSLTFTGHFAPAGANTVLYYDVNGSGFKTKTLGASDTTVSIPTKVNPGNKNTIQAFLRQGLLSGTTAIDTFNVLRGM
jgi:hypothetical protein